MVDLGCSEVTFECTLIGRTLSDRFCDFGSSAAKSPPHVQSDTTSAKCQNQNSGLSAQQASTHSKCCKWPPTSASGKRKQQKAGIHRPIRLSLFCVIPVTGVLKHKKAFLNQLVIGSLYRGLAQRWLHIIIANAHALANPQNLASV